MNMSEDLFASSPSNPDPAYRKLVEYPRFEDQRRFLNRLYLKFEPYADSDFESDFPCNVHSRFWEMYLFNLLEMSGFRFIPRSERPGCGGPDLGVFSEETDEDSGEGETEPSDDKTVWIEAVAPGHGEGDDAVPELSEKGGWEAEHNIVLRICSAIKDKFEQHEVHIQKNLVSVSEPFVIAVCVSKISGANSAAGDVPYVIQAALPFGKSKAFIDRNTMEIVDEAPSYRPKIKKQKGANVPTTLFLDSRYSAISALIFSSANPIETACMDHHSLSMLHNPRARNPLPSGWLRVGVEWQWLEHGEVVPRYIKPGQAR
jgi:hypothetical protein